MGRAWFTDFENISADFDNLNIVCPKISNANFMQKQVTAGTPAKAAVPAQGTNPEQPAVAATEPTIAFTEITEGIFGRKVFIVVDTEDMQGDEVSIELVRHDDGTNDVLSVTDGTADVTHFTARVGDISVLEDINGDNPYGNLTDFEDKAIFKIDVRPHARADFDTWAEEIDTASAPSLKVRVKPVDSDLVLEYGSTGEYTNTTNPNGFIFGQYDIENKNVYEIYHKDNLFNTLGTHTHNAQVVRRRISSLENDSSTDVIYFFHNISDNIYEISTCVKSQVRRRSNGKKIASTSVAANVPSGYAASQNAPTGGDAVTNYYYNHFVPSPLYPNDANENALPSTFVPSLTVQTNFEDYHTIVTIDNPTAAGKDYGVRRYALADPNDANDLVDLIRMPDVLSISEESGPDELNITFTYRNTQRRYCNPACFAGFLSVLAQLGRNDVVCTGMCFGDATSYPSVTHPNGDSVDTAYLNNLATEQLKVNAFRDNYFTNIHRGNSSWYGSLTDTTYKGGHARPSTFW